MLSEWDTAVSRTRISPNKSNIHLFASVFYGPVITVKVMSSRSVKLFTPFLGRLRPLRGSSTFVRNCQLPFLLQTKVGWGRGGENTVEMIPRRFIWPSWVSNLRSMNLQSDALPTALWSPV